VKKVILVLCAVGLLLMCASSSFGRLWSESRIEAYNPNNPWFDCGYSPSLALLYGVQPVVSNYDREYTQEPRVVHQTAFGWESYSIAPGYIAGNGGTSIVSFDTPVTLGQDGHFYGTAYPTASNGPMGPVALGGGTGPAWIYDQRGPAFASADSTGAIYMAAGNTVARYNGSMWSPPVQLDLMATDLAISPFGDIAVAGLNLGNGTKSVAWFDFQRGQWIERALTSPFEPAGKVDVEWDKLGNLGVAYADLRQGSVGFDYLDMATGAWTSEIVSSRPECRLGAALAFDRFGNPVIASGSELYYDLASVPEPSAILALASGLVGLVWRRRTRGTPQR